MIRTASSIVGPILATAIAASLGHCSQGCKPSDVPSVGDAYAAEQAACVEKAKTIVESRVCRAEVDRKYQLCETPSNPYPCLISQP